MSTVIARRVAAWWICCAACTGAGEPSAPQPTSTVPGIPEPEARTSCDPEQLLGPRVVRLAGSELKDHVRASLPGVDEQLLSAIDLQGAHLAPVTERVVSGADFGAYYAAAKAVAEAYAKAAPEMEPCRIGAHEACLDSGVKAALTRLYRREPSAQEWNDSVTTYQSLVTTHLAEAPAAGVLVSVLLSPQLLYQTERGDGALALGAYPLSRSEALSRARFALTGKAPLPSEVSQLSALDGEAFKVALGELAGSWVGSAELIGRVVDHAEVRFGVEHLAVVDRSDPAFTPELQTALAGEFREYVQESLLSPTGSFAQLFSGTPARIFPGLEGIYAGADPLLNGSARRKGVLGLASLLAARAGAAGSDPVKRGLLVRIQLLCEPMPPPIAGADFSKVMVTEEMQTRERFEALAALPTCKSCHEVINPPGYLFEEFDHLGRYRNMEKGRPINATGTITPFFDGVPYPGVELWDGIVPLAEWLARSPEARSCFASHFADYVLSQGIPQGPANCNLPSVSSRFSASGRISELVADLVQSDLFLYRTRRAL